MSPMLSNDLIPTLRDIAARASWIHERRAREYAGDLTDEKKIDARLEAWLEAVSEERDRAMLERLWEWAGLDPFMVRQMVAPVTLRDAAPLPRWAEILGAVLSDAAPVELPSGILAVDAPLPFQELWLPFVAYAQRELAVNASYAQLIPPAQAQLGRALLKKLAQLAAEPLFLEFSALRNRHPFGGLAALVAKSTPARQDTLYQKFIAQLRQGGLLKLFEKYPVLARLLGTALAQHLETRRTLLVRLAQDADDLARVLGDGTPLGRVAAFAFDLSESHHGGESVTAVTFESGLQLVYKPKDLALEVAYNDLLRWLAARDGALDLLPLWVLNRGTHGWVTFAQAEACADAAARRALGRWCMR